VESPGQPSHAPSAESAPRRASPARLLGRPWFWVLAIAVLFSFPLVKALRSHLPPPLPGEHGDVLDLELPDETGATVALHDLRDHLVLITALPLANAAASEETLSGLYRLRKHLRGLDKAVAFVMLCRGGDSTALVPLLDERKARKPLNLFLLDQQGEEFARLASLAGSASAEWLLLDRHGRARGVYGADPASLDALVRDTGQLANWVGQDPPP
jgi:hypothetical protein